jgi:hypothetical protein
LARFPSFQAFLSMAHTLQRQLFRLLGVALAAVLGSVSLAGEAVAGTSGRDRAAGMMRDGCCCVMAASGCCCESPASVKQEDASPVSAVAVRIETPRSMPTCQCLSGEPAQPSQRPVRRGAISRADGRSALETGTPLGDRSSTSSHAFRPEPTASPPKSRIYLHTSHLLI